MKMFVTIFPVVVFILLFNNTILAQSFGAKAGDAISPEAFANPPLEARPGVLWC